MSNQTFWQCLSVEEFFSSCNWQGSGVQDPNSSKPRSSWQCLTVQEFFSHSNWKGVLLENRNNHQRSLSLTMPVSEFFKFIVWEGNPSIATLPKLKAVPENNSSMLPNI